MAQAQLVCLQDELSKLPPDIYGKALTTALPKFELHDAQEDSDQWGEPPPFPKPMTTGSWLSARGALPNSCDAPSTACRPARLGSQASSWRNPLLPLSANPVATARQNGPVAATLAATGIP